jgi:centromere protein S
VDPDRYAVLLLFLQDPNNESVENISTDLEAFAHHAGRTTINTDDVLLITRRTEGLNAIMKDFIDREKAKKGVQKARGRPKK